MKKKKYVYPGKEHLDQSKENLSSTSKRKSYSSMTTGYIISVMKLKLIRQNKTNV